VHGNVAHFKKKILYKFPTIVVHTLMVRNDPHLLFEDMSQRDSIYIVIIKRQDHSIRGFVF